VNKNCILSSSSVANIFAKITAFKALGQTFDKEFTDDFSTVLTTTCMHILLTGGTGFIGRHLTAYLLEQGHSLTILTRRPPHSTHADHQERVRYVQWDAGASLLQEAPVHRPNAAATAWQIEVAQAQAVLHLAGEGIFDGRWTGAVKQRLMDSRVYSTRALVQAMAALAGSERPTVFVSASAVGYYGNRFDEPTDESAPAGTNFLAEICVRWEQESQQATALGVRVANPRIGIVLEPRGGALERMALPFRLGLGMPLGSGKQWIPWIHIDDLVRGLAFPLEQPSLQGAYNLAAPGVVQMAGFSQALATALHRPYWSLFSVPEFALQFALGEAAEALTGGQRIVPKSLLNSGFRFNFPEVSAALHHLLQR